MDEEIGNLFLPLEGVNMEKMEIKIDLPKKLYLGPKNISTGLFPVSHEPIENVVAEMDLIGFDTNLERGLYEDNDGHQAWYNNYHFHIIEDRVNAVEFDFDNKLIRIDDEVVKFSDPRPSTGLPRLLLIKIIKNSIIRLYSV